jgi:hypothetical protein
MTQEQMKKAGWLLIILGTVMQVASLAYWGYFFYVSLILLDIGYYLSLKRRACAPFRSRYFYEMIVVSIFPIIGPIAAIILLCQLPNLGEQFDPARKRRASLVSVAFVIALISLPSYIAWVQFRAMKDRAEYSTLLTSAKNHINQAEILKGENKDFSVEVALAQNDLQRTREFMIDNKLLDEDRKAKISIASGDIFCLQGRYDEAARMYKDAGGESRYGVKERLTRSYKGSHDPIRTSLYFPFLLASDS